MPKTLTALEHWKKAHKYYWEGNRRGTIREGRLALRLNPNYVKAHWLIGTEQIESYISTKAGTDLSKVVDQYLRTTNIPLLKYNVNGKSVSYHYERVVKGFAMPIRVIINGKEVQITPGEVKQTFEFSEEIKTFEVNRNFYIEAGKGDVVASSPQSKGAKRRDVIAATVRSGPRIPTRRMRPEGSTQCFGPSVLRTSEIF